MDIVRGQPICSIGLSPKVENALLRAGIKTVEELRAKKPEEIRKIKGIGEGSLRHIYARLIIGDGCELCAFTTQRRVMFFDGPALIGTFTPTYCPVCGKKID